MFIDFERSLFVPWDGTPPSNYGLVVAPSLSVPIGFGGAFFNGSSTIFDFLWFDITGELSLLRSYPELGKTPYEANYGWEFY